MRLNEIVWNQRAGWLGGHTYYLVRGAMRLKWSASQSASQTGVHDAVVDHSSNG